MRKVEYISCFSIFQLISFWYTLLQAAGSPQFNFFPVFLFSGRITGRCANANQIYPKNSANLNLWRFWLHAIGNDVQQDLIVLISEGKQCHYRYPLNTAFVALGVIIFKLLLLCFFFLHVIVPIIFAFAHLLSIFAEISCTRDPNQKPITFHELVTLSPTGMYFRIPAGG